MSTEQIVLALIAERDRLNRAIEILGVTGTPATTTTKRRGRPPGKNVAPEASTAAPAGAPTKQTRRKKRTMSPEARARIAAAQRKRWAAAKKK
jgi:hypothetical protein